MGDAGRSLAPGEFGCGVVEALPEALGWPFIPMEGGIDVQGDGVKCLWDALGIGLGIFSWATCPVAHPLRVPAVSKAERGARRVGSSLGKQLRSMGRCFGPQNALLEVRSGVLGMGTKPAAEGAWGLGGGCTKNPAPLPARLGMRCFALGWENSCISPEGS